MEIVEGIILKQINYKESSKIIYLYTKDGLISVLVHGSNKLKSPYLNLVRVFSQVKLHVSGKDLKTLRDGEVINNNIEFTSDFDKYTYILHLTEVIYYFSGHDHDHEKLFLFLIKIFKQLRVKNDYMPYINMVELKLLYLLGVQPKLDQCVICESTTDLSFSIKDGGLCCGEHRSNARYDKKTINLLKTLYFYDLDDPKTISYEKSALINLRLLLDEYYEYHLNYRSRSRKMLKELLGY